jgi:hypothetical protein
LRNIHAGFEPFLLEKAHGDCVDSFEKYSINEPAAPLRAHNPWAFSGIFGSKPA